MPPINNFLRRFRRAAGYSQGEVATVLGLRSPTSVSRWEHGQRLPSVRRLLELSCLYRRLVNDLLRPLHFEARARIEKRIKTLTTPKK